MATATRRLPFFAVLLLVISLFIVHPKLGNSLSTADHSDDLHPLKKCNFGRIYQLGDSISDTGNLIMEKPLGAASVYSRLPYGKIFFGKPSGRCSDGLLMIDYIALYAGLPLLNPYKNTSANFSHGANFAVAGSTALSTVFLASKNFPGSKSTNSSLNVQLDWMSTHFNFICSTDPDCGAKFKSSLFMVGEIGGNDYNYALFKHRTTEEAKTLTPHVIQAIMTAARKVIKHGATKVVVPGNFPIGCFPHYQTLFQTNNSEAYDDRGCLKDLNNLAMFHNEHLQQAVEELQKQHPDTLIVYGDYYNAFQWLLSHAGYLGFHSDSVRKACIEYVPNVSVCPDSRIYISWDGMHPTQEAYKVMATWLTFNIFPKLQCII